MQVESIRAFCNTFELPPVFKTSALSIFEWPFKTDFTLYEMFPLFMLKVFVYLGLWNKYLSDPLFQILSILFLFDLILYVHSTIFQLCGTGLPGLNQY